VTAGPQPRRGSVAWLGRLCAVLALGCMVLALVAVQRGRVVQASSERIVADVGAGGDAFEGVDFSAPGEIRLALDSLAATLSGLRGATRANVDILNQIAGQARALSASAGDDLGVSRALADTVGAIGAAVSGLRATALGGEGAADEAASTVQAIVTTVRALNAELARLGAKLAFLPELGA